MQLDPLKLPSGGMVEFKDTEDLTGRDYLQLQRVMSTDAVQVLTQGSEVLAPMLISRWDIPDHARLPVPGARGGNNSMLQLGWRDTRAIYKALIPVVREILFEEDEDSDEGKDDAES